MIKCELDFHPNITASSGSCGLDFWQSKTAIEWISQYLECMAVQLQISDGFKQASILCMLRRLPGNFFLASAYPYCCIEGDKNLFWRAKSEISFALRKHNVVRLELAFTGEFITQLQSIPPDTAIKAQQNLEGIRHIIDLTPAHTDPKWLEKNFGSKVRWAMRKAERMGATIRPALPNESDIIQNLYIQAMRAKGAPVNYGKERFQGLLDKLQPCGIGDIFIGEIDNKPAGFAAVVKGQASWHLIQIAVSPQKNSYRLSELLIGTIIRAATTEKIFFFDFMASNKKDKGLIAFKAKWHGKSEPIFHVVIPTLPFLHRIIPLGRWLNQVKGKINAV